MLRLDTIIDLLISLNNQNVKLLFEDAIFCLSFIKILDKFSKNMVLHLCSSSINLSILQADKFFLESREKIHNSLRILKSLNIIEKKDTQISLIDSFRTNLIKGFCNIEPSQLFVTKEDFFEENIDVLNLYFEIILEKNKSKAQPEILSILISSNIITSALEITNIGFDFLLKTKKEQIWFLLIQALNGWKQTESDLVEAILHLFEMSLISNRKSCYLAEDNPKI